MNYLDLSYPHGYLVWKGTQKVIVNDELFTGNEYLITTGQDAFCKVVLRQPSVWTIQEFDRQNELHCYKSYERRLKWPKAKLLYTYPVKIVKTFSKPLLFRNGKAIDYQPKGVERKMIIQASELPAKIVLDPNAICVGEKGFNISEIVNSNQDVIKILEAFYETKVSEKEGNLSLPIYQLALVRSPRLVIEKEGD